MLAIIYYFNAIFINDQQGKAGLLWMEGGEGGGCIFLLIFMLVDLKYHFRNHQHLFYQNNLWIKRFVCIVLLQTMYGRIS